MRQMRSRCSLPSSSSISVAKKKEMRMKNQKFQKKRGSKIQETEASNCAYMEIMHVLSVPQIADKNSVNIVDIYCRYRGD